MEQRHITPREYAQLRGVRLDGVYRDLWSGRFEAKKVDGRWLIPAQALDRPAKKKAQ